MKPEFQKVLQVGVDAEKTEEEKQQRLKQKFGIEDDNVVVVERSNTFKFAIKLIAYVLRFTATVILLALALIGIAAIFYAGPRREMLILWGEVIRQIQQTIPATFLS